MKKNYDVPGVYEIVNIKNHKRYIGESIHCLMRWGQHRNNLRKNKHPNCHLQRAWNIYGENSFEFHVLEICNIDFLTEREIFWIAHYDSMKQGYNQTAGGDQTPLVQFSEERSRKISQSMTGRKFPQNSGDNSAKARKIICINDGRQFGSIKSAAKEYDIPDYTVSRSVREHTAAGADNLVFVYAEDYSTLSEEDIQEMIFQAEGTKKWFFTGKEVIRLNDQKIFYNASYAAKELGINHSNLSACCKGRQYSCGRDGNGIPYVWMYLKDYKNTAEADVKDRLQQAMARAKRDRVVCINTGEVYLNSSIAATENNISYARMLDHLAGKKPYAGISLITNEPLTWKRIS